MGFSSLSAIGVEMQANQKVWRTEFSKAYGGATATSGRWYDLAPWDGSGSVATLPGTYIRNGNFLGGFTPWTATSGLTFTPATHLMTKGNVATVDTLAQTTTCSSGVAYNVTYTIGSYAGTGYLTASLGGTNGSAMSGNGIVNNLISCGATVSAPFKVTFPSTITAATVDLAYVRRMGAFTPCSDVLSEQALWHGGDVSGNTKHIINAGVMTNSSTAAPGLLMVVDVLGVYPLIQTNATSAQVLFNDLTLPRYTNGEGVQAYFATDVSNGANVQYFIMSYTNSAGVSGRCLGQQVLNTASAIQGHISHSNPAAAQTGGPFLPLLGGDKGVRSVQTVQFSAASAAAGYLNLVLCKPLITIPLYFINTSTERDYLSNFMSLPVVKDGACIQFLYFAGSVTATGSRVDGYLDFAWGNA